MSDNDLLAIYTYLGAIPCVAGPPAPSNLHNDCGVGTPTAVTKAVANPKGGETTLVNATLDGTQSTSFNGQPLTYQWTTAASTQAVQISGATTATPSVIFLGGPGTYTFFLTVTDSTGGTSSDSASITLIP